MSFWRVQCNNWAVKGGDDEDGPHTLLPFQHCTGVGVLVDTSHHPTVFQSHALQQPVIHVVPNPDGEDAKLFLHSWASVPQDRSGLYLPDGGPSVRQENNEGDAVRAGVRAAKVMAKQRGASLHGVVDVCSCSEETSWQIIPRDDKPSIQQRTMFFFLSKYGNSKEDRP